MIRITLLRLLYDKCCANARSFLIESLMCLNLAGRDDLVRRLDQKYGIDTEDGLRTYINDMLDKAS